MTSLARVSNEERVPILARNLIAAKLQAVMNRANCVTLLVDPVLEHLPIVTALKTNQSIDWSRVSIGLLSSFESGFSLEGIFGDEFPKGSIPRGTPWNTVALVRVHADGRLCTIPRMPNGESDAMGTLTLRDLNLMDSLVLTASGRSVAATIATMVEGQVDPENLLAVHGLRYHRDVVCVLDTEACRELSVPLSWLPIHARRSKA